MNTDFPIDSELLEKAQQVGGEKTKKATVEKALREYIARRRQHRILGLFGQLDWNDEYDYKLDRMRW